MYVPMQAYRLAELLYLALSAGYQERARWWGAWDLARRLLLVGVIIACSGRSVSLYIHCTCKYSPFCGWVKGIVHTYRL